MYRVEFTVLSDHRPITVTESLHRKHDDADKHAGLCAKEYASRFEGAWSRKTNAGANYIVADSTGLTFAQFSVV